MRKGNSNLSHDRLQEVLHYNPETGEFRWKVSRGGKVKSGDVAGRVTAKGHQQIEIDYTQYQAHRLAWLYQTGAWPTKMIDHINRVKSDNRFINLREVTSSQNAQNSLSSRGSSRYRGVSWVATRRKWWAQISINGKQRYLGSFDIEEEAAEAYKLAQRRFHPFAPVSQTASDAISGNLR